MKTYEQIVAENPEHAVVIHGEYCISKMVSPHRIEKIKTIVVAHFNK